MDLGMIGLGRMGGAMVRRLLKAGHRCVVHDVRREVVEALQGEGAVGAFSLDELMRQLPVPRLVWMMLPAGLVDETLGKLVPLLQSGDTVIDGATRTTTTTCAERRSCASGACTTWTSA